MESPYRISPYLHSGSSGIAYRIFPCLLLHLQADSRSSSLLVYLDPFLFSFLLVRLRVLPQGEC